MNKSLWEENKSDRSPWANSTTVDDDIEQSDDWMFKESLIDKLKRMFCRRKNSNVKVLNYNDLTNEERLSIPMDDYDDYNCGCKCDLKECDTACSTYFELQDQKPYRNVDINIPELNHLAQEQKLSSYSHFKRMLNKRNKNPYYFFKYMFSKIYFWNYKRSK